MEEAKKIWVVGDIHGMYDPLKRLITELRRREALSDEKVGKIIFIGDYIDYGPSSKEVLDLLMNLEYETVFMAGNHEDMLLHYCKKSRFYEEYGNMWFNGNGGQETVLSFNPEPGIYRKVNRHPLDTFFPDFSREFEHGDYKFGKKYMDFFLNLVYSHTETLEYEMETVKFAFSHAGLDVSRNLDDQLKLKNYDDFHSYVEKHNIYQKSFNLWSRQEPNEKYGDYILVHGHTPTEMLPEYYKNMGGYKPESGLPYFRFPEPQIRTGYEDYSDIWYFDGALADLISINIDTGAVFGNYLTAIGFDSEISWNKRIEVIQVATGGIHRGRKSDVREYEIKVNRFGKG